RGSPETVAYKNHWFARLDHKLTHRREPVCELWIIGIGHRRQQYIDVGLGKLVTEPQLPGRIRVPLIAVNEDDGCTRQGHLENVSPFGRMHCSGKVSSVVEPG